MWAAVYKFIARICTVMPKDNPTLEKTNFLNVAGEKGSYRKQSWRAEATVLPCLCRLIRINLVQLVSKTY